MMGITAKTRRKQGVTLSLAPSAVSSAEGRQVAEVSSKGRLLEALYITNLPPAFMVQRPDFIA
jgi:hypothetical protein